MKKIVKDAVVLMAFSLVLGLALGAVYSITKPVIDENLRQKELAAYKVVFEDAATLEPYEFDATAAADLMRKAGYDTTIKTVIEALDADGKHMGYVVSIETSGFKAGLMMTIGVREDGTVNGFEVTANNETGPGPGAIASEDFAKQFEGAKVDKFVLGDNVDAVAGATITSTALTEGCNAAMLFVQSLYGEVEVEEPPTPYEIAFAEATELKEITFDADAAKALMEAGGYNDDITALAEAYGADGTMIGYMITITAHDGYHGDIILAVGIKLDGTFAGYAAIEQNETKGFGTQVFDEAFYKQFFGVNTDKFVPGENVDLIVESTISSTSIVNACNAAIEFFNSIVGGAK